MYTSTLGKATFYQRMTSYINTNPQLDHYHVDFTRKLPARFQQLQ